MKKDYYTLLGLSEKATKNDVKKAYKHFSLKLHPDKHNNDPFFNIMFLNIKEAFDVLYNDETRKVYDLGRVVSHAEKDDNTEKENDFIKKIEDLSDRNRLLSRMYSEEKKLNDSLKDELWELNNETTKLQSDLLEANTKIIQYQKDFKKLIFVMDEGMNELTKIKANLTKFKTKSSGVGCTTLVLLTCFLCFSSFILIF